MPEHIHRGSCACGAVKIEARGEPYRVGLCHCLTCRKAHAAPFNFYAVYPVDAVTVTGDVLVHASSEPVRRYACAACGAQVHSTYGRPDEIYVYPGSFDEPGLFKPTYELWTVRRESWLPELDCVITSYERNRPKWRRSEPE